ncbi:hypothetical protein GCM10011351_02320 [Paraliobacillus quinghaiensis]|uniref:Uncharacterized protein n=1 Tax=Paraliobacillus quinghaiensis TaxID=470815 RepID=A0A917TGM0_9BACI|nr:hypothetical protein [Paraliobacillus quinghaiensis]GGM20021.1 hypothetical protein GCM10011351_02320 [Paraliobacillus quinghaiensis]
MSQAITQHPYVMIERKIINNQQVIHETVHDLYLYSTYIISTENHISINSVHDISYRALSSDFYFLYLHTNKGVLTFQTKINPESFIVAFRKL